MSLFGDYLSVSSSGGGSSAPIASKTITQNGIYNAHSENAGGYNPVTVNVSGGGIILVQGPTWDALTTAQKQSYGLVAIQRANSGYYQGELVNGADYFPFDVQQSGWAASACNIRLTKTGVIYLLVLALNSEASTKTLTVTATQNGNALTGDNLAYHSYQGSGDNRRNYRVMLYQINGVYRDLINISLTDQGGYGSFVYALLDSPYLDIDKQLSHVDTSVTGTNTSNGMVVYGGFRGSQSGTINVALYEAGTSITAYAPSSSYGTSYIFWFVEAAST